MSPLRVFSSLKSTTHQRRRIIPLFVLGIVSPSVLLGLLAFRGIQNDRALLEKERLEANRRIADQVIREVDGKIGSVEAALTAPETDLSDSALQQFKIQQPLVEEIFALRQPNGVDYPAARLLYLPDDSKPPVSRALMPSSGILAAQRLEFREKDYAKALAAYRQALKPDGDPQRMGEILNAVARVQKKSGLLREAAATYEHILQDYGGISISDGIPLGAAARLERASLFADLNDIPSSASTLLDLYRSLLQPEWPLKKAQFEFFIARVKKEIEDLCTNTRSGQNLTPIERNLQLLETEEKLKRSRTERAIAFQAGAGPALEGKLNDNGKGRPLRLTIDIDRYSYLVSIPKPEKAVQERSKDVLGLILEAGELKNNILRPALLRIVSSDGISWVVRDRDGGSLLVSGRAGTGPPAVQTGFVSRFPDWSLEIYQQTPNFFGAFLGTRHGIYSYMFLLIGGILTFGLVLTIRTVSHELELAKMKSDLVSTISHEFKSPLAAIRQLAEMLHSGRIPSEDRRQKYYDILLEQSERLSLLTDNVLNLARIEEGRKEFFFQPADLGALVQEAVSSMREQVGHEGFEIELDAGKGKVTARIDRESMFQAIANLLDNAVKYSGDSKHVSVRLAAEDEHSVITIHDSGIGIREEELGRVFERFYRCGDELARTVRGTGLGLSLVKEIVEAHKGSVHVDSEPGKGSTFTIRLPLTLPEGS